MDKLQPVIVFLKKFHFWVLLGVAAILGTVAWNMAASTLCEDFDARKGQISGMDSELQSISSTPEHPNDDVIQGLQEQTETLRKQVVRVWSSLYDTQRKDVLYWPKGLTSDFLKAVENGKFGDEISPIDRREEYQEFVKKRLSELPEIIKAKISERSDGGAPNAPRPTRGRPLRAAETKEDDDSPQDYLVVWKGFENLERRFHWEESPSSMRVWVAQEDLWVYETLLKIIAATNKYAKGAHNSTVSVIDALEVGEDASSGSLTQGRVMRPPATGDAPAPAADAPAAETPAVGVPSAKLSTADLALVNNRYLDTSGKPLPGDQRSQVAEYKRMPIRMILNMDPKEIPRLLAECANASLPVEVQQVRINASGRGASSSDSSDSKASSATARSADEQSADHRKMHLPVVIQGIIYIFNPPDMTKLAPPGADGQPAPAGAAAAAPAGAVPAPGPTPGVPASGAPAPAVAIPGPKP